MLVCLSSVEHDIMCGVQQLVDWISKSFLMDGVWRGSLLDCSMLSISHAYSRKSLRWWSRGWVSGVSTKHSTPADASSLPNSWLHTVTQAAALVVLLCSTHFVFYWRHLWPSNAQFMLVSSRQTFNYQLKSAAHCSLFWPNHPVR